MNQLVYAKGNYDTEEFEYDSNGNITKYKDVYNEQGFPIETTYTYSYDSVWKDRLTGVVTDSGSTVRTYTYEDQYGTGSTLPTTDGRYSVTWDGRMLISATRISDNKKIDFEYDHDGKLTKKTVTDENGSAKVTKYYYTDGSLTTEARYQKSGTMLTLTEKLDYIYDSTGLAFIIMEITNDSETYISSGEYTFYVKRNAQGDITALTDITSGYQDGTVYYTYSAYGKGAVQGISGDSTAAISVLNSMLFKGYMYDSDFKMYYLGSRWYDPEIGRFINGDSYISTGQGIIGYNMFAYCGNNPVNRADPEGNFFGHIIAALVIVAGIIITASSCSKRQDTASKPSSPSSPSSSTPSSPSNQTSIPSGGTSIYKGSIRICTDGSDGTKVPDANWYKDTALTHNGKPLDAYTVPYVVRPIGSTEASLGDKALLINHDTNQMVMCVVGEAGPAGNGWGEVSIAAIWMTGNPEHMTANHASGLSSNYEIILFHNEKYEWSD